MDVTHKAQPKSLSVLAASRLPGKGEGALQGESVQAQNVQLCHWSNAEDSIVMGQMVCSTKPTHRYRLTNQSGTMKRGVDTSPMHIPVGPGGEPSHKRVLGKGTWARTSRKRHRSLHFHPTLPRSCFRDLGATFETSKELFTRTWLNETTPLNTRLDIAFLDASMTLLSGGED